jgi:hypothetical protein
MREAEIPVVVRGQPDRSAVADSEVIVSELRRNAEAASALDLRSQLERARITLRSDASTFEMPNVLVLSSTGAEVWRHVAEPGRRITSSFLADIDPSHIASIEVYKGNRCPTGYSLGCPLIRVTLKPGMEGKSRPR